MNNLLFPSKCIFCGVAVQPGKLICKNCMDDEIIIGGKICTNCGVGKEYCECRGHKYHYQRRIACVYYKNSVRRGIARFKFYRQTTLAEYYGRMMAENIRTKYKNISFELIIPVPMHPWNRILRGYNCAELLAKRVAEYHQIPLVTDVLLKQKLSKPQKRVKLPAQRAANILDAFLIRHREKIVDKTILLVDDVCTTGATLNECAKMLRLYGASHVYAVTMAAVARGS